MNETKEEQKWDAVVQRHNVIFTLSDHPLFKATVIISPSNDIYTMKFRNFLDYIKKHTAKKDFFSLSIHKKGEGKIYYGEAIAIHLEVLNSEIMSQLEWIAVTRDTYGNEIKEFYFNRDWYTIQLQITFKLLTYYEQQSLPRPSISYHKMKQKRLISFQFDTTWLDKTPMDEKCVPEIIIKSDLPSLWFVQDKLQREITLRYTSEINVASADIPCELSYDPRGMQFSWYDAQSHQLLGRSKEEYPLNEIIGKLKYIYSFNTPFKWLRSIALLWGIAKILSIVLSFFSLPVAIEYYIYGGIGIAGLLEFFYTWRHLKKSTAQDDTILGKRK